MDVIPGDSGLGLHCFEHIKSVNLEAYTFLINTKFLVSRS